MKNRQFHKAIYHLRNHFFTLNNLVIIVAIIVALGWVWGSLSVMQRNYALQQQLNAKERELQLAELETRSLELEAEYRKTYEYQELAARRQLGLASAGEKVLIVPERDETIQFATAPVVQSDPPSVIEQWGDFLFGLSTNSDDVAER